MGGQTSILIPLVGSPSTHLTNAGPWINAGIKYRVADATREEQIGSAVEPCCDPGRDASLNSRLQQD